MKHKLLFIILSFCLVSFTDAFSQDITEPQIIEFLAKIDAAINEMNVDGVADALSDDVKIEMTIQAGSKNQVMRPSKAEYVGMLRKAWSQYRSYIYNRSGTEIYVEKSKAIVTADIVESMSINGQIISGVSEEEVTIKRINGELRITDMVGITTM